MLIAFLLVNLFFFLILFLVLLCFKGFVLKHFPYSIYALFLIVSTSQLFKYSLFRHLFCEVKGINEFLRASGMTLKDFSTCVCPSHHFMENTGGKVQTVTNFIFLSSKITVNSDCSYKIKRRLLLRKPGMLQSMGLQRVRHNWVTELNWNQDCQKKYQQPQICRYLSNSRKWRRTKSVLMRVKEESEKINLKLNIQKG